MSKKEETSQQQDAVQQKEENLICGIIMPISSIDGCPAEHWKEVKDIITESITAAGYKANLVSDADDSGVIQRRIVQNLYDNKIVICDVSGKNPNVMFELGLRLAFDKPTIVIMDDKTNYSFDTAPIEHLKYPRDLRYSAILSFKEDLKNKILATIKKADEDPAYSVFLRNFGEFKVASIEHKEGSMNEVVLAKLDDLASQVSEIKRTQRTPIIRRINLKSPITEEHLKSLVRKEIDRYCEMKNIEERELFEASDNSPERQSLFKYVEQNDEIRMICGSPAKIAATIDDLLIPF